MSILNSNCRNRCIFPHTIRDLNALPESVICLPEIVDGGVAKFNSLVGSRD